MALWSNRRSKRIQRVFEDVYLHASRGVAPIYTELLCEPYTYFPRFIKAVRLFRPYVEPRRSPEGLYECLDVVYEQERWPQAGTFYLKSHQDWREKYDESIEASSARELHPIIVEKILLEVRMVWMRRRIAERDERAANRALNVGLKPNAE